MRVALLTTGRFTLVDLGRELSALGHDVSLYSLVPKHITRRFGLPDRCNRWLGAQVAPFYLATKIARNGLAGRLATNALLLAVDAVAARVIEPCDVMVSMSGIGLRAVDVVQRRHKAKVFLERSSRHILSQREILEAIPGIKDPVPDVNRELAGYALADVITVPSRHVEQSFLERGFAASKLFYNPFGVSLDGFPPTAAPPSSAPKTVLMVGGWSLQKGCDVLVEAWRGLPGVRLLHVGPIVDAPVPRDAGFEHVDSVPQSELPKFYAQAHVVALASRQDGFGVVLAQALACGVKLVCTSRTGGEDLKPWVKSDDAIRVVPPDDPLNLRSALASALEQQPSPGELRDLLGDGREQLSWRASAVRYAERMQQELG